MKSEPINASNGAESTPEESTASYQQFVPTAHTPATWLTISKIISIFAVVAAFFTLLCCFFPFLATDFFGTLSFNVLNIISAALDDDDYLYLAIGGIAAIIGAAASLLFAVGSLAKSNSLIGSISFSIVGIIGSIVAVSENWEDIAIGFVTYQFLSVMVVALSLAALSVRSREQPTGNDNISTIKDKTLFTITGIVLTVAVVAAILLSVLAKDKQQLPSKIPYSLCNFELFIKY